MTSMPRYVQLDDWIFEIKAVRALRVGKYGDPYSAIANLTVNGDTAYIDGLMTREQDAFTRKDFQTFRNFCAQLNVKQAEFDRFKNNQLVTESVSIPSLQPSAKLQLIK